MLLIRFVLINHLQTAARAALILFLSSLAIARTFGFVPRLVRSYLRNSLVTIGVYPKTSSLFVRICETCLAIVALSKTPLRSILSTWGVSKGPCEYVPPERSALQLQANPFALSSYRTLASHIRRLLLSICEIDTWGRIQYGTCIGRWYVITF